jgi:hypothetical protein
LLFGWSSHVRASPVDHRAQSKGERISGRFVAVAVVVAEAEAVAFGVAVPFGTAPVSFVAGPEALVDVAALAVGEAVVAAVPLAAGAPEEVGASVADALLEGATTGVLATDAVVPGPVAASPEPVLDLPPNVTASTAPTASIANAPTTIGHFFRGC